MDQEKLKEILRLHALTQCWCNTLNNSETDVDYGSLLLESDHAGYVLCECCAEEANPVETRRKCVHCQQNLGVQNPGDTCYLCK